MTWENAWQEGRTGWDAGAAAPSLRALLAADSLPGETALVPGCGAGYDVFEFAEAGIDATGLDLAPTAAKRFEALREQLHIAKSAAQIVTGDFFAHEAPDGGYDIIWDYTFCCAIQPEQRPDWANKMASLLAPDGELVTLIFPIEAIRENNAGPPFQLTPEQLKAVLEPKFNSTYLEPVTNSHPGREGLEWLGRWKMVR